MKKSATNTEFEEMTMKLKHYSIVTARLLLFTGSSFSDDVVAKSSISSVTISPSWTTIVREAD